MQKLQHLCTVGGNVKWCSLCRKQYVGSSKKINTELPYYLAIPPLGIFPRELKAGTQTDTYTPMFIAALFTIAKRWKQPKCPSTRWMDKEDVFYIYVYICIYIYICFTTFFIAWFIYLLTYIFSCLSLLKVTTIIEWLSLVTATRDSVNIHWLTYVKATCPPPQSCSYHQVAAENEVDHLAFAVDFFHAAIVLAAHNIFLVLLPSRHRGGPYDKSVAKSRANKTRAEVMCVTSVKTLSKPMCELLSSHLFPDRKSVV